MSSGEQCEEKLRLLTEYQRLASVYSVAISKLVLGITSEADHKQLKTAAEAARLAAADARDQLQRHIAQHHC